MITLAVCQMCPQDSVTENLKLAEFLLEKASCYGANFALLPEMFSGFFPDNALRKIAEDFGCGPIQSRMVAWARKFHITLAGSIALHSTEGKLTNSCLVFNERGELLSRYDKRHLFFFDNGRERYNEADCFVAGKRQVTFLWPAHPRPVRVTIGICYDLRFPEHFVTHPMADLILLPSAFAETTGKAHWEALIRARAIENSAYVAASNLTGSTPSGRTFFGHAAITDPWGSMHSLSETESDLLCLPIDIEFLDSCRRQIPAATQRYSEIYGESEYGNCD